MIVMAIGKIGGNSLPPMHLDPAQLQALADQTGTGTPGRNALGVSLASNRLRSGWEGVANASAPTVAGVSSGEDLSSLTDAQVKALGANANVSDLRALARAQPDLTVGQVTPLLQRPEALDDIAKVMGTRTDLRLSDFVSHDPQGRIHIDPSVYNQQARSLLRQRDDINPSQLTAMRANFAKQLQNPMAAKDVNRAAIKLLEKRHDIQPQDATAMLSHMIGAVGGVHGQNQSMAASSAADMFEHASKLLEKRHDLGTSDMNRLADAVGGLGGKKDRNRATDVDNAFDTATKALGDRRSMPVDQMISLANTMKQRFPGDDTASSSTRVQAFTQGVQMVTQHPGLGASGVGAMLARASAGPPARKGAALLDSLSTMNQKLNSGKANLTSLTDRSQPLDSQGPRRPGDVRLKRDGTAAVGHGPAVRLPAGESPRTQPPQQPPRLQRPGQR